MPARKDFYRSKEWESFRRVIIAERTDEDGFIRCALCGKPIVHKYDLIIHHKRELNEANVNDAMVALNPDNVECVHFKCHNELHDRWQGGNNGWHPKPKQVHIVYGSPLSGKSTWVRSVATGRDLIVDMDSIWDCITAGDRYDKPDALRSVAFELRDKLYDVVRYRAGKWQDAYVITGGATVGDRERLRARVDADDMIFIDTGREECLKRLEKRDMGAKQRELWRSYIEDWFSDYQGC